MKIIETIAQKFNLSPEDVLKSLELSQDYKQIDLLKALGIYSMFGTKEEHEEYIKSKLKNYHEQLTSRENESKEKKKKNRLYFEKRFYPNSSILYSIFFR